MIIDSINSFYDFLIFLCSEQTRGNPGTQSNGTNELLESMSAEPPERITGIYVLLEQRRNTKWLIKRHASFF